MYLSIKIGLFIVLKLSTSNDITYLYCLNVIHDDNQTNIKSIK